MADTFGRPQVPDGYPTPRVGGATSELLERGIRNCSWVTGKRSILPKDAPFGDVWMALDYLVPGMFINWVVLFPKGPPPRQALVRPIHRLRPLQMA